MKDLIIPVNNEALSRALIAIAGEERTVVILEAYRLIDAAMIFGYQKGLNEAAEASKAQAEEYVGALQRSEARGDAREFNASAESYDDGYVDGVSDARSFPDFADDQVALLCADAEYDTSLTDADCGAFMEDWDRDEYYEGDSGDENDSDLVKANACVEGSEYVFDIESGTYVPAID